MKVGVRMAKQDFSKSIQLKPDLNGLEDSFVSFCQQLASEATSAVLHERIQILESFRNQLIYSDAMDDADLKLVLAKSVILDLIAQGWQLTISPSNEVLIAQFMEGEHAEKDSVRESHLWGRNAQLREKSVRQFIRGMERPRLNTSGWHSIYSLMRDGRELADQLEIVNKTESEEERQSVLSRIISPYIQFVEPGAICEHTGLRLNDIWRYFRHTWTNEYKSVPGRLVMILIRDAAATNHPVIGIAALGSSVVQNGLRDEWIGWKSNTFVDNFRKNSNKKTIKWLLSSVDRLVRDIYTDDLKDICSESDIEFPSHEVIKKLMQESEKAILQHRESPQRAQHNKQKISAYDDGFFQMEAESYLFRSKRCKQLSKLLSIRLTFQTVKLTETAINKISDILETPQIKTAFAQLIRMIKAEHVGIDMMDVTVCGAIAPYNAILGGKLVCMLLCSPEVTQYYNSRYKDQVSVIASGMSGSPVIRKPNLVLLCTTSLYGMGSSQYNRVKIPLRELGESTDTSLEYRFLGHSVGYGTYQFSFNTIRVAEILNSRKKGPRVNSIFGEGVNPLMRKIREALSLIKLDHDQLLLHGNQRVTYVIQLADNFRNILLGIDNKPNYLLAQKYPISSTQKISKYWRKRWLSNRIRSEKVLAQVSRHTLSHPVAHEGRVILPIMDEEHPLYEH